MDRPAFIEYKSLATGKPYCVHGKTDDKKDCKDIPANEEDIPACKEDASSEDCKFAKETKYDVETLKKVRCVCRRSGHWSSGRTSVMPWRGFPLLIRHKARIAGSRLSRKLWWKLGDLKCR